MRSFTSRSPTSLAKLEIVEGRLHMPRNCRGTASFLGRLRQVFSSRPASITAYSTELFLRKRALPYGSNVRSGGGLSLWPQKNGAALDRLRDALCVRNSSVTCDADKVWYKVLRPWKVNQGCERLVQSTSWSHSSLVPPCIEKPGATLVFTRRFRPVYCLAQPC